MPSKFRPFHPIPRTQNVPTTTCKADFVLRNSHPPRPRKQSVRPRKKCFPPEKKYTLRPRSQRFTPFFIDKPSRRQAPACLLQRPPTLEVQTPSPVFQRATGEAAPPATSHQPPTTDRQTPTTDTFAFPVFSLHSPRASPAQKAQPLCSNLPRIKIRPCRHQKKPPPKRSKTFRRRFGNASAMLLTILRPLPRTSSARNRGIAEPGPQNRGYGATERQTQELIKQKMRRDALSAGLYPAEF